jgi:hypothetical protein
MIQDMRETFGNDLDLWMDRRRSELGLRWEDVAERADGVTTQTLREIRGGRRKARSLTKAAIERALQWTPGSIDSILAGGEPANMPDLQAPEEITTEDPGTGETEGDDLFEVVSEWVDRLRAKHGDRVARVYVDGLFAQPAQPKADEQRPARTRRSTG